MGVDLIVDYHVNKSERQEMLIIGAFQPFFAATAVDEVNKLFIAEESEINIWHNATSCTQYCTSVVLFPHLVLGFDNGHFYEQIRQRKRNDKLASKCGVIRFQPYGVLWISSTYLIRISIRRQ